MRVSLNDPVFVSAHEGATNATPDQLSQVIFLLFNFYKINIYEN